MVPINLFARKQWRNRHREQIFDHGEREERVRCMERVTWKLTLPCKMSQGTQIGSLYQPRGWDGEGDGKDIQKGGDMVVPMADSC